MKRERRNNEALYRDDHLVSARGSIQLATGAVMEHGKTFERMGNSMRKEQTVTVTEARVYKVYFDTGDFDPYNPNKKTTMPLFSCVVIANSVKEAIDKTESAFPGKLITNIHTENGVMGNRSEAEKVVF